MKKRQLVALVATLGLVVAACGGDDDSPADDGASPETTAPADDPATTEPADAAPTTDADDPPGPADADAVLRFQWGTPAGSNYDPHTAFNQFANVFLYPAYDHLTELTTDGELVPMLAESWEFLEDDTVLRLNLRDGVVFHDGEPFDAEAVKANIERGQTLEASAVRADLASIADVVVVDELTVDLVLTGPGAALPALLADRAGMMVSPAAFDNEDLDLRPVGAGPFKVVDHQPASVIVFERFEDYWDPDAQGIARLEISMQLDPEARFRAIQDGQIDGTTLNADQADPAAAAGLNVQTALTAAAFLMYLNKTVEGLDDPLVRRAISHAIDREGLAAALHAGRCLPSTAIFPASYWAGDPTLEPDEFDVDLARDLMEQAGFGDGLALDAVVANVPFYTAQLEALQAMLGEIGIDLTVTSLEPTELLSRFASGDSEMYFSMWPGAVDPAKTVASLLAEQSSLNPGGYTNPTIDQLAAEGLAATEQADREPIYQQIAREVAEDHFHIVVCNPEAVWVVNDRVQNLTVTLGGSYDFRNVTITD